MHTRAHTDRSRANQMASELAFIKMSVKIRIRLKMDEKCAYPLTLAHHWFRRLESYDLDCIFVFVSFFFSILFISISQSFDQFLFSPCVKQSIRQIHSIWNLYYFALSFRLYFAFVCEKFLSTDIDCRQIFQHDSTLLTCIRIHRKSLALQANESNQKIKHWELLSTSNQKQTKFITSFCFCWAKKNSPQCRTSMAAMRLCECVWLLLLLRRPLCENSTEMNQCMALCISVCLYYFQCLYRAIIS